MPFAVAMICLQKEEAWLSVIPMLLLLATSGDMIKDHKEDSESSLRTWKSV